MMRGSDGHWRPHCLHGLLQRFLSHLTHPPRLTDRPIHPGDLGCAGRLHQSDSRCGFTVDHTTGQSHKKTSSRTIMFCRLLSVPGKCTVSLRDGSAKTTGALPHRHGKYRSNLLSHPVTADKNWANQSKRGPCQARRQAGQPQRGRLTKSLVGTGLRKRGLTRLCLPLPGPTPYHYATASLA